MAAKSALESNLLRGIGILSLSATAGDSPFRRFLLGPSRCSRCGRAFFLGKYRCPKCRGNYFTHRQARAHLVVALLRSDQLGGEPNPRAAQIVLTGVVKIQKPSSYYATTVVREAGRPQVHLAFEDKGDARKFAASVEAEPTDSATVLALAATLPAPATAYLSKMSDRDRS